MYYSFEVEGIHVLCMCVCVCRDGVLKRCGVSIKRRYVHN